MRCIVLTSLLSCFIALSAQSRTQHAGERATVLHTAVVYVDPDANSQKVSEVTPGHEVVIVDR